MGLGEYPAYRALADKHEDLSSAPHHSYKTCVWLYIPVISVQEVLGEGGRDSLGLLVDSLAEKL